MADFISLKKKMLTLDSHLFLGGWKCWMNPPIWTAKHQQFFHRTCKRRLGKHRIISWKAVATHQWYPSSVGWIFSSTWNFQCGVKISQVTVNSTIHPSTHLTFRHLEREREGERKREKWKKGRQNRRIEGRKKGRKKERKQGRKREGEREYFIRKHQKLSLFISLGASGHPVALQCFKLAS